MIAMQYKIMLPDDYDMNTIRKRVADNGSKTDGFQDLLFKAYLISTKSSNTTTNEYSPLYLWNKQEGMNHFIFDGFYDNILKSFEWQKINIGIPLSLEQEANFSKSKFALEIERDISVSKQMHPLNFSMNFDQCTGKVILYNPDKWKCVEYYFFELLPQPIFELEVLQIKVYTILHLSI